jgi:hypothetical protein
MSLQLRPQSKGGAHRAVQDEAASALPNAPPDTHTDEPSDKPSEKLSCDRDIVPIFRAWPTTPQPLKKNWFALLGEIALLAFPIAFIGRYPQHFELDDKLILNI